MKMKTILSGRHYMMVVNKIHKEYFTCNVLSCNGNIKARFCVYPNGKADLYEFNGVNYEYKLNDIDVSALYAFVKDQIPQKKVYTYLNKCYKDWQDAHNEYLRLEEESVVNPKPNVDYEELIYEVDYNLFLKHFCYANPKKYKKLSEKVAYSRMYDNIIDTKYMLIESGHEGFEPMIHSCDKCLLYIKETLASLEVK